MVRVLVAGGTGTAGRQVVAEALRRGHDVTVASRHAPDAGAAADGIRHVIADITLGSGLDDALEGVDVVVDTTNGLAGSARAVLTVGAANLLHAAARHGVASAVVLSIVNVDRSSYSYYQAKAAQEQIYRDSTLATRVVRATQFHDLATSMFSAGSKAGFVPAVTGTRMQSIAVRDVAGFLVDAAEGTGVAENATANFGGPEVLSTRAMAQEWKAATGSRALIVPLRMPGQIGREWRSGLNLVPDRALGTITYSRWLAQPGSR